MKKISSIIFGLLIMLTAFSCDPSQEPGKEAAREHNENVTAGSGATTSKDEALEEDTVGTTGNFQPRTKGSGSTPADGKGNSW